MQAPTPEVIVARQQLRAQPRWKPAREVAHLRKRQRRGHLPAHATMDTYNQLIRNLAHAPNSLVYRYPVPGRTYYAVRGLVFEMDSYVHTQGFEYMGTVGEVLP